MTTIKKQNKKYWKECGEIGTLAALLVNCKM